jgi:peptidoglycan/LPS O-acetylase OafA/YrhL
MLGEAAKSEPAALQASGGVRYTELDSLRGVAALTVLFYHFRLMWFGYGPWPPSKWWLTMLSPIAAGHEAVMLFFLLSGFVLAVPYLRGRGQRYPVYLARRVLRIYGPYFFALWLAIVGAAIWHGALPLGEWPNLTWNEPVRLNQVLQHLLMIGNFNWSEYNTAFWSLVIEMRVSLVFPVMFWVVNRMKAWTAVACALVGTCGTVLLIHLIGFGYTLCTFEFGMIFVCGIVMAKNVERINAWYRSLPTWSRVLVGVASFGLYTCGFQLAYRLHPHGGQDQILITIGAAGYLVLALNARWAKWALGTRIARFLGRISYSLYLVHGTVLFALAHALGRHVSVFTQLVLFIGISIGLSYLFCVVVEEQFLRLSRMVGKRKAASAG